MLLGGTVFKLHTRKSVSRLQELHIHCLAAISSNLGLLHASFKRGPYSDDDLETWIHQHLQKHLLVRAVLVSDSFENTPQLPDINTIPRRLRLAPLYTDRLNPCEAYWSKISETIKTRVLSGEAHLPAGGNTDENQRLVYLERLLTDVIATVSSVNPNKDENGGVDDLCASAVRNSTKSLTDVLQFVTGLKEEPA